MKLYIANCTRQNRIVYYRVAENPAPRQQHIDIGRQTAISGELNTPQVEGIIEQLRQYGMVSVDEIDRTRPFIGLCYSVDKPIKVDAIMRAIEHNAEVLTKRGQELRKEAAVAVSNTLEDNVRGQGDLKRLDVTIEEQPTKDGSSNDFAEALRVERTAQDHKPPRTRGGRGRKAA